MHLSPHRSILDYTPRLEPGGRSSQEAKCETPGTVCTSYQHSRGSGQPDGSGPLATSPDQTVVSTLNDTKLKWSASALPADTILECIPQRNDQVKKSGPGISAKEDQRKLYRTAIRKSPPIYPVRYLTMASAG